MDQAPTRAEAIRALAVGHADEPGPLLVVLHAVMAEHGHIDPADVPVIADVLNLSVADVHGVVTFYHDFRTTPPPAHTVSLCRAEACQAVGAESLYAQATGRFAGRDDIEVAEVFCFGNCALGPSGMVDRRLYGRLTDDRLADLTKGW
ncbi:NAD(P)H-dependent oxidoreductase subunit E [Propionibacteriaceae bacterium Y2011]|uniref:NAD(P)H-dependent oxidoreductase subunit E n=1 Tax=Microlunatus sp. Y2014 TaxID=3418488 RepID=UPI003B479ADA